MQPSQGKSRLPAKPMTNLDSNTISQAKPAKQSQAKPAKLS